jgi:hypothetical protein
MGRGPSFLTPLSMRLKTCTFQIQIIQNSLPGVLINNSTGILKKNSEFLVAQMNNVLGSPLCPDVVPDGPPGV